MTLPPGPRGFGLFNLWRYSRNPLKILARSRERYGDSYTVRIPTIGTLVYVADPAVLKSVFTGDPGVFHAGAANLMLEPVLGSSSVLLLDDAPHMRERKLMLPPFHGENVRRYAEIMAEVTERQLARWPLGRPRPVRPLTQAITLEVILRAVFGIEDPGRVEEFRRRITRLAERSSIVMWLPGLRRELGRWSPWARFKQARAAVDELLYEEIRSRRDDPATADRADVLSLLLQARHEDGEPMSDRELRDELMTLVGAGHETTATGLAWALERLARHPAALRRLVEEIDSGEDDAYLGAVVKETLRVRPVVPDVGRLLAAPAEVAGHKLPQGTMVVPSIALVHMREDLYPDPHAFRPERFLNGAGEDAYSWIPFGGGVRRCIGATFAQVEMKVVLRTLLSRVVLRPTDERDEIARLRGVTIVPSRGARVSLEARRPATAAKPTPAVARAA